MTGAEIVYKDLSYRLVGACFEVYNEMGHGFLEAVYQDCLEIELTDRKIPFDAQRGLELHYKSATLKQEYFPDFLIENKLVLEIKAVRTITDEHRAQLFNYLHATSHRLGILANFGHHGSLQHERIVI